MYAYETPKASEAKSEPAKKSRGGTDTAANHILTGNRGFDDRGSDPLSLKQALMQNIGTEHYTPVSSEGSAVVQLKDTAEVLPPLSNNTKYARHHIIPDGTMKNFIEALIKQSKSSKLALGGLMQIIDKTNKQYTAVWDYYTDERIGRMSVTDRDATKAKKERAEAQMNIIGRFWQKYQESGNVNIDDLDGLVDKTFIVNMFQWLPGNLVIGRNNRTNDPKNKKASKNTPNANLDLEVFRIKKFLLQPKLAAEGEEKLKMLETAMENYIKNPDDTTLESVLAFLPLLYEFDPSFEATPDGIWDGQFLKPPQ